jgi:hypothetical protein
MGKRIVRLSVGGILSTITSSAFVALTSELRSFFLAILIIAGSQMATAQTSGTILGRVSDSSGASISNANVTVENLGTNEIRKTQTNAEGTYLVPSLPPGQYKVTAQSQGFKVTSQSGIQLQVAQNARVDAQLEVGSTGEVVNVQGTALQVDTQSSALGETVDSRRLQEIPLNGRNALQLAELLPGIGNVQVSTAVTFARNNGSALNVSGSSGSDNNIMLDGTTLAAAMTNLGVNLPNPDSIEEFKVLTNTFSPEYGRAGGGEVLAVTKSGTNALHGSFWEFLRNDGLNARNYFAFGVPKPYLRQNQFGASVGGPVVLPKYDGRKRTFLFFSYQGLRISQNSLYTSFPATTAERQGDFSASPNPVIDPLTGLPFPGNIIPTDRLDPLSLGILKAYVPLPNQPDGSRKALLISPTDGNQFVAKIDHLFTQSEKLSFRYYRNRDAIGGQAGLDAPALAGLGVNNFKSFDGSLNSILTPNLVNDFRMSFSRQDGTDASSSANKNPKDLGGNFNTSVPSIPMTPQVSVGARMNISPQIQLDEPDTFLQFDDKLSWIKGKHHITTGLGILRVRHRDDAALFSSGLWIFAPIFTGNDMADFMIGRPLLDLQLSHIVDDSSHREYSFFFGDDFKATKRLTLNLGLRYEVHPPWVERNGNSSVVRFGQQSTKFPSAPLGLLVPGDKGVPPGLYPTDWNDIAPRVGFAWDPTGSGRTAIRGAYGIFFLPAIQNTVANTVNNQPWVLQLTIFAPHSFSDPWAGTTDPFPYDPTHPTFLAPLTTIFPSENLRDSYTQQYNLNVQHQFGSDVVLQVAYVGKVSRKLITGHDLNQAVWAPGASVANVQQRRPYLPAFFGAITTLGSNGSANYNSLQVNAEKRFSHGFTLQGAYTFSKSLANFGLGATEGESAQDQTNFGKGGGEYGYTDFDQRHILTINGIWDLPSFRGKNGIVDAVFGGWKLAGVARVSSGLPFNLSASVPSATGGTTRPNVIGDPILDSGRPRKQVINEYFNTSAFVDPVSTPSDLNGFGDFRRNGLIGPGFASTDMSVSKYFSLPRERLGHIGFRVDFFNLFNRVNLAAPGGTVGSPTFGKIFGAGEPRIVQLGLKWDY